MAGSGLSCCTGHGVQAADLGRVDTRLEGPVVVAMERQPGSQPLDELARRGVADVGVVRCDACRPVVGEKDVDSLEPASR